MTVVELGVNQMERNYAAPLRNITVLEALVLAAQKRPDHLPGIVSFSGPSGFGKSTAAASIAANHEALYIEVRSTWTKKAFLEALLRQMGIEPKKTVYQMMDQVSEELACSQQPLIIDEFDHAIDRNLVEMVRDIYEQSKTAVVLIGEERLPQKLQKWERFHGRIMEMAQAQAASIDDARCLAEHYIPALTVKDDLLALLVEKARGSVRRIVTNLERINKFARAEGLTEIGRDDWGGRDIHEGKAPVPRDF